MRDDTFLQRLQESAQRRPFEPFDMQWPDGERMTFDDPQALAFRNGMAVHIDSQGVCMLLDARGARRLDPGSADQPPRSVPRTILAGLLLVHLLGICGSVLAATIQIESILGTGPVFGVFSLLVAACGRRARSRGAFWVGLSTLALCLFVFGLINVAELSPDQARVPVSVLLLTSEAMIVPAGLIALWRLFRPAPVNARAAWQFDLQAVLWFTGLLAVGLAAGLAASDLGLYPLSAIAVGMLVATLIALAWMGYHGRR